MKFNLLPVLFSALPLLLLELATPANAAALCIPGIYCPVESTPVPSAPECSCTAGSGATGVLASSLPLPTPTLDPTESCSTTSDDTPSSSDSSAGTSTADPIANSPSGSPSLSYSLGGTITADPIAKSPSGSPSPSGGITTADPIAKSPSGSAPGGGSSTVYGHGATTTVTVTATSGGPTPTGTTCSTGPVQCCNSVKSASSADASKLLGLLGVVLQGADIPVGLTCSPLSVLGLGSGANCNAQTVCCQNNSFNGLINIGCTPINLSL